MPKANAQACCDGTHCKFRLADGPLKPNANDMSDGAQFTAYSDWQMECLSQMQTCDTIACYTPKLRCLCKKPRVATLSGLQSACVASQAKIGHKADAQTCCEGAQTTGSLQPTLADGPLKPVAKHPSGWHETSQCVGTMTRRWHSEKTPQELNMSSDQKCSKQF